MFAAGARPTKRADDFKRAVRAKALWRIKVQDTEISHRYVNEAVDGGLLTREAAFEAITELQREASEAAPAPPMPVHVLPVNDAIIIDNSEAVVEDLRSTLPERTLQHATGSNNDYGDESFYVGAVADGAVPASVRDKLERDLDYIAHATGTIDWHPFSHDRVQNIIHPSLFPLVAGKTVDHGGNVVRPEPPVASSDRNTFGRWRSSTPSRYQWLPSEFIVNADGTITIDSYINNLDREEYPNLYDTIAEIFRICVPLLEASIGGGRIKDGSNLQVVVKAANYVLPPGSCYEGTWHKEGMTQDSIAASAIYYYSASGHLSGQGLAFRRERDQESDYPSVMDFHTDDPNCPSTDGMQMNIELGVIPTIPGRIICFPNNFQHKVLRIENTSEVETAYRKILCFFLVDPSKRIPSTRDVPMQQWGPTHKSLSVLLDNWSSMCTAKRMPLRPKRIISSFAQTFSLAEAREHRLKLISDRKAQTSHESQFWEEEYTLCEH